MRTETLTSELNKQAILNIKAMILSSQVLIQHNKTQTIEICNRMKQKLK
jgi:hypothetical protein